MWSNENADTGIESILFFVSAVVGIIKQLCIAVNQKKLGININAAIDDWLFVKDDEETRKIMKKYAIKARILTFILLYSACGCFCIYISAIVFINLKQIFFTDSLDGLRINLCLNEKNHVEMTKSVLVLNYLLTESLVLTYGGDFLQRESEGLFYALYTTSWFTLPLALMKDLHFAMMRSSIPFRLTGGKFFYVNRETMMYILKTAVSYVSVLRIALKE
ncbi:hypothetical protein ACFW04_000797 [Cataglyphis niger]